MSQRESDHDRKSRLVAAACRGRRHDIDIAGDRRRPPSRRRRDGIQHESEIGVEAPESIGPAIGQRDQASGGGYLKGEALTKIGSAATYPLELPQAIDDAQLIFRYARLHWRSTMVTTHGPSSLPALRDGQGRGHVPRERRAWGYKPSEWGLSEPVSSAR